MEELKARRVRSSLGPEETYSLIYDATLDADQASDAYCQAALDQSKTDTRSPNQIHST